MRLPSLALVCAAIASACSSPSSTTKTTTTEPAVAAPATPSRIETRTFHSDALGVDKAYVLYLPAGYDDDPARRWPVFYYLHGLTGDETNWTESGAIGEVADKLGLRAILVMPDGDDGFYTDAASDDADLAACLASGTGLLIPTQPRPRTCVAHRAYETYIIKDLIGHIDTSLRTIATRDGRGIAGLSMGGFGALQLSLRHKDLFAAAASHSGIASLLYRGPHPYQQGKTELYDGPMNEIAAELGPLGTWIRGIFGTERAGWLAHDPVSLVGSLAPGELALYLDCGTEDGFQLDDGAAYLDEVLRAKQIDHVFFLGPGEHDFTFWRVRVPESLAFLAAHVTAPR